MKFAEKKVKFLSIYLVMLLYVYMGITPVMAANTVDEAEHPHGRGLKPMTQEDKKWMQKNMVEVKKVRPNRIGLDRANEVRKSNGLKELDEEIAVEIGEEVLSKKAFEIEDSLLDNDSNTNDFEYTEDELSNSDLKSWVDNSELMYFPPIEDQGSLSSCISFSTTYYQATYMNAMARGWNVKDDSEGLFRFSPKWSYNLTNGGRDDGGSEIAMYRLLYEQGIATWNEFEYDEDYKDWPVDLEVWKNARNFKPDAFGYVELCGDTDTPIQNEKDECLENVKQLLFNGYILVFSTDIDDWNYKPIKSASRSNAVGRAACYMQDDHAVIPGAHSMTIVGYDDNVWVDINGNGSCDEGEKGAFKIANSWGSAWKPYMKEGTQNRGDGFVWLCYDALNKVSKVKEAPEPIGQRYGAVASNKAMWMSFKNDLSNEPSLSQVTPLIAEISIEHPERNQLRYEIGHSEVSESDPEVTWGPAFINTDSGKSSFRGSLIFDYNNLMYGEDLSRTPKNWYLKVTDIVPDGKVGRINSFRILDTSTGNVEVCTEEKVRIEDEAENNSVTLCIKYKLDAKDSAKFEWSSKKDITLDEGIKYSGGNLLSSGDKLYLYCQNESTSKKGILMEYNPLNDQWSVFDNSFKNINRNAKAVIWDQKMYIFGNGHSYVDIYDMKEKKWEPIEAEMPLGGPAFRYDALVMENGKIYIIGGCDVAGNPLKSVYEFDTQNYLWTKKADMEISRSSITSVAVGENIYIFGGRDYKDSLVNSMEKLQYDGDWVSVSKLPEKLLKSGYTFKAVSLGEKIYLFAYGIGTCNIYEYNTISSKWTEKNSVPGFIDGFGVQTINGRIYLLSEHRGNILEFIPGEVVVSEPIDFLGGRPQEPSEIVEEIIEVPEQIKVEAPVFNLEGGEFTSVQELEISCPESDAVIRYTTDGTEPDDTSPIYSGPITVTETKTVKAYASKAGMADSAVASNTFYVSIQLGDVNGDGKVNANDYLYLHMYSLGFIKGPILAGDINGDGIIDSEDVKLLRVNILG